MSGVLKIEITESQESLKELLSKQKTGKSFERLQTLYWLSSGQAQTVDELASLSGHHRTTVSRWLSKYRQGGLSNLLNIKTSPGRNRKLSWEIEKKLVEELADPEGFSSYEEVQTWLKAVGDVEMSYTGVHKLVRYRLKSKLKVPRPSHVQQKEGAVETFKKTLHKSLMKY
jgi:transposase